MLIESYTREAGVRNLERQLANVCRKVTKDIAVGDKKSVKINEKEVNHYLGAEIFHSEVAERCKKPGVVIGLAWTAFGGDILFIEASKIQNQLLMRTPSAPSIVASNNGRPNPSP